VIAGATQQIHHLAVDTQGAVTARSQLVAERCQHLLEADRIGRASDHESVECGGGIDESDAVDGIRHASA